MQGGGPYLLSIETPPAETLKGAQTRRYVMKQTLIALALIAATSAPVAAEGFPNPYQTIQSR